MTTSKSTFAGLALIAALCTGFTLGLTAPAWAGSDEAMAAFERGDYATALREFRPLAEQGNAVAQYNLGLMYRYGRGIPQDYTEALQWWRKAAEQGWADAQFNLGTMYGDGHGVPQDYAKAVHWYRKAAEQGNTDGQVSLGIMYGIGRGLPRDLIQAHMWFNLGASSSKSPPGTAWNAAVEARDRVAREMTPAQISEAQKLAREWKPKK